ncbi:TRAP transporter permease [Salipiger abyssi]|uniref:TRAP transporter permease n=1 Tax=Salipiger abyssi TaxID=1250539 RepID=UPI001A8C721E|nr:TRAP transporter fused permease subunit [Salipiger abyssi]MBN9885871.1 TRAP transporter fused permease subunit [Salipiger abyssi]
MPTDRLFNLIQKAEFSAGTSSARKLSGLPAITVIALCAGMSLFVFSINSWLLLDIMRRSGIFAAMLLAIVFLCFPASDRSRRDRPTVLDWGLAVTGVACGLYIYVVYHDFISGTMRMSRTDMAFALAAVVVTLEAGRRVLGIWMPALAVIFLLYAIYGQSMPGPLAHFGIRPERLLLRIYMVDEGLFGSVFQIAQTYIALFVLFGAFLTAVGASGALTDIGLAISGRATGGPAKVAVASSALTGMISGTASANVATTGTITIPLMKRAGFPAHVAGAVEAIASTGGLIMPPVMGAAAFLLADFVGMPYYLVVLSGIVPALLYFGGLILVVHVSALRNNIGGVDESEMVSLKSVLLSRGYLLLPVLVLLYMLLDGKTPIWSAMTGIVAIIAVSFLRRATWLSPARFLEALVAGAIATVPVAVACLVAGLIVVVVTITGAAQVFTSYIDLFSGGYLVVALLLTALAAILLSCALPATAIYIVVAVTVAPALVALGAQPLAAHFFVFWFGVMSNITPPVAIACFTAAGIAGAKPTAIALAALRMGMPALVIPFALVMHPELLLIDWTSLGLAESVLLTGFGIAAWVFGSEGWFCGRLGWPERAGMLLVSGFCLFIPEITTGYIGAAIGAALMVFLYLRSRRASAATSES